MKDSLANAASETSGFKDRSLSARDLMECLVGYEDLHESIAKHRQVGVYHRFAKEWSFCLAFLESEVNRRYAEAFEFARAEKDGSKDDSDSKLRQEFDQKMYCCLGALERHARGVQLAREMSRSSSPTQLFMNFFRAHFRIRDGCGKMANGEDTSHYGSEGTLPPCEFQALDAESLNPMEALLAYRLLNPFEDFICRPCRYALNMITGRGGSDTTVDAKVVNFTIISAIAKAIVCMLANLSLAAAIGTLNSIDTSNKKLRIIIMTVVGQVFASLVSILGPDSIPLYTLITSYFQAMVIFVGTTSEQ